MNGFTSIDKIVKTLHNIQIQMFGVVFYVSICTGSLDEIEVKFDSFFSNMKRLFTYLRCRIKARPFKRKESTSVVIRFRGKWVNCVKAGRLC